MSKWIRKGDKVVVITGNEKGRTGLVSERFEERVIVEGLNMRKKHVKRQQRMQQGIIDIAAPMHISNVSPCDAAGNPVKLRVKIEQRKKQLVYHNGETEVVYREIKHEKN